MNIQWKAVEVTDFVLHWADEDDGFTRNLGQTWVIVPAHWEVGDDNWCCEKLQLLADNLNGLLKYPARGETEEEAWEDARENGHGEMWEGGRMVLDD